MFFNLFRNRHVSKLLGASFEPSKFLPLLIFEFMDGGTLRTLIDSSTSMSWNLRLKIIEDIVLGIIAIHFTGNNPVVCYDSLSDMRK